MSLPTGSFWTDLSLALAGILYLVYWYFSNNFKYWDERGVPNVKGGMFLNTLLGRKSQAEGIIELYKSFPGVKYFGMFQMIRPTLILKDPDLIHKILVKDFNHFQDRGNPVNKKDPMFRNLFNLQGSVWRAMRYKLTPTFSTGKLKGMFEQLANCGDNMAKKIEELIKKNADVEAKSFLFEFTSEVISSCAFGLQFEPGTRDFTIFQNATSNIFKTSFLTMIKFVVFGLSPKLAEILDLKVFIQKKEADYFLALIKATTDYRKENKIKRNDYLQLLLSLQEQEENGVDMSLSVSDTTEDDAVIDQMKYAVQSDPSSTTDVKLFTDVSIAANSVIFLIAGSESVSSTITHTLLELARHPEVQERLQREVDTVLSAHGHRWTYQTVKDMTYLDQVVQEAQRLHPIIPLLMRQCTKPYKVPGSDLVLDKGMLVAIPVIALHKDPQHYDDPEAFRPERFEGNNFKPSPVYLPYGDGPRICIALRFAVMEVKTAIARIMADYSIKLSPRTKLPIKQNPRSFFPLVEGGVWLTFQKRHS